MDLPQVTRDVLRKQKDGWWLVDVVEVGELESEIELIV